MRLSEKLEAADGRSRELDIEVWKAFNPDIAQNALSHAKGMWPKNCSEEETKSRTQSFYKRAAPAYTTSIDAALTLLPDGWQVDSLSKWDAAPEGADNPSQARSQVCLLETSIQRMRCGMIWGHSSNGDRRVEAVSSTPALALCAAICRAKGEG